MANYNIRAIRRELKDFYGSAMGINMGMTVMNLQNIDKIPDDEIVEFAKSVGINVEKYREDYER